MKITEVRVREVSIPRIYDTYCADPQDLQIDIDHGRSRYQVIELFTDAGLVGLGEVSDIAGRMAPLTAGELQALIEQEATGRHIDEWCAIFERVERALPDVRDGLKPSQRLHGWP